MSEDREWVWIVPKEINFGYQSQSEYFVHNGKWIVYGQKGLIQDMGSKMLGLVGKDDILEAKFSKKPALDVPEGHVLGRDHALIVYCDDRKRDGVREKLKEELKVDKMFWKYDRQTLQEILDGKQKSA